jgi:hypothetical protein
MSHFMSGKNKLVTVAYGNILGACAALSPSTTEQGNRSDNEITATDVSDVAWILATELLRRADTN